MQFGLKLKFKIEVKTKVRSKVVVLNPDFFSNPDIRRYNPDNIRISVFPSTEPWNRLCHGRWRTASRPPQDGDSDRRGGEVGRG